jgi:hypothetical protein
MTKIKLLSFAALLLFAGIILVWQSNTRKPKSSSQVASNVFALQDTAKLSQVVFGEELAFQKNEKGVWRVNSRYNVDKEMWQSLLMVLKRLEIKRTVSPTVKDEVANAYLKNGIPVRYYDGKDLIKNFLVWNYQDETYAMFEGGEMYVIHLPGYKVRVIDILARKDYEWRDRSLIESSAKTLQSISLSYPKQPEENFDIIYTDFGYQVKGIAMLDTAFLFDYLPLYSRLSVEEFIYEPALRDSLAMQPPYCVIELKDLNHSAKVAIYPTPKYIFGIKDEDLVVFEPNYIRQYFAKRQDFIRK